MIRFMNSRKIQKPNIKNKQKGKYFSKDYKNKNMKKKYQKIFNKRYLYIKIFSYLSIVDLFKCNFNKQNQDKHNLLK